MSQQELSAFFVKVTNDKALQERLYVTHELSDVAVIAAEMGFKITGAEILRAQANRVLTLPLEGLEVLVAGLKPKNGAQWGRSGKGYLDRAGFWLMELAGWDCIHQPSDPSMLSFLAKIKQDRDLQTKLRAAKTFRDVAVIANEYGFNVLAIDLLRHQARLILTLNNDEVEMIAQGAGDRVP